jgi:radical S-adenosyl methionine domain-containing protein 2
MQTSVRPLPETVNYHLNKNCNFRCRGCYAIFDDSPAAGAGIMLPRDRMFQVVDAIAGAPLSGSGSPRKLTFAGGEPTLCKWLPELIAYAKSKGLVTMLVTNGSRCSWDYLADLAPSLDWLTLSIDSLAPVTNIAIGRHNLRGIPMDAEDYARILSDAASLGIRTKVNTVVNRLNWREEMSQFIRNSGILRWKVLQIMQVDGQNDAFIDSLLIDGRRFDAFLKRHRSIVDTGIRMVPEPVASIRGSYCMIDPLGRFFDSSSGHHRYSRPILKVGIATAFAEVSFDHGQFLARGGSYDFLEQSPSAISPDLPAFSSVPALV